MIWLHRFAKVIVVAALLLVVAGSLVTSTGSGLAVPGWPAMFGLGFFTERGTAAGPDVFFGEGHRLVATAVGLLVIGLAAWVRIAERRRWVRRVADGALAGILLQGVLGGLAVLFELPAALSLAHAALAHLVFCTLVAVALFTSPGWLRSYVDARAADGQALSAEGERDVARANSTAADLPLRRLAVWTTALIFVQVVAGAAVRHAGAGLAIPDYPLSFGRLVPTVGQLSSAVVSLSFLHRLTALVAAAAVFVTIRRIWVSHGTRQELVRPAAGLAALVLLQIVLGGVVVVSGRNALVNAGHVSAGAVTLATALVIALRAWRPLISRDEVLVSEGNRARANGVAVPRPSSASALSPTD